MAETLTIISERVDDIPLLLAQMERMGLPSLLDEHFPTHGNWQGLSLGWVTSIWLSHILSQADHRLNHVQPWAHKRLETLCGSTRQKVRALDFSDDRLGDVLCALNQDWGWEAFEGGLNRHLLRVYDLGAERVRVDSTSASGYWGVTPDGVFQFGHSKDHRPDLPQVKVMMATLDPLALPVATDVVPGDGADDPLYLPAIRRVRESLGRAGLLYVGDCKMAALQTRAFLEAGGDFYLCPLSEAQLPPEVLEGYLACVWAGQQELSSITRQGADGKEQVIAEGFEQPQIQTVVVDGQPVEWMQRQLVVRSLKQSQGAKEALLSRLEKAQRAIEALNQRGRGKRRLSTKGALREAAEGIVKRYRVEGLLRLTYPQRVHKQHLRRYRDRPEMVRIHRESQVKAEIDEKALQEMIRSLGWRVYATNKPEEQLSLAEAVLAYRNEYLIEHGFGRLKGQPLSLTPMYLQRDDHATGLIRLLSIGLRVLTLLEFIVRRRLAIEGEKLAGLYAGNPRRTTARPTAEAILETFQDVTLTVIQEPHQTRRHLTPLSQLQQHILALLDFPEGIYSTLYTDSPEPP